MQVVHAAVGVQGGEVARELVALNPRAAPAHPAVEHRDVQAGHGPRREPVDRGREHPPPGHAQTHAVQQLAVHVVGGGPRDCLIAGRPRLAGNDDGLAETEGGRQLERQVSLQAARAVNLDVDDAFVARPLQVAGHGRCVQTESTRDLDLALARDVKPRDQVRQDVRGRPG